MNVLIVDNDHKSILSLTEMLNQISSVRQVKSANCTFEAIKTLCNYRPDVVLLAIEMPGGSGFDFLDTIRPIKFKVIFITTCKDYAFKAIKMNACGYLLKPINFVELNKTFLKLSFTKEINLSHKISIKTMQDTFFVKLSDIMKLSSVGSYCIYHLVDGREIVASYVLKTASVALPKTVFFRTHNSHVVNLNFVTKLNKIDGLEIVMKDKSRIPLSRRRKDEFLNAILNLPG